MDTTRRSLITGLMASVAALAMARLAPVNALEPQYDWVEVSAPIPIVRYEEMVGRLIRARHDMVRNMFDNLYQPYGEPSFPTTTPRQIRT